VSHAYIGRDLLIRFGELIKDHGTVERPPVLEGKSMSMVVTSLHKPKSHEPVGRPEAEEAPVRRTAPSEAGGSAAPSEPTIQADPPPAVAAKAKPAPVARPAPIDQERVPAAEPAGG